MEHYDIIIIGAGPAGLRAAQVLSGNKRGVLILEKNPVPCQKICAEGITAKVLELKYFPRECITKEFYTISTFFQKKHRVKFNSEKPLACCISRVKMGKLMAEKAIALGTKINYNEKVIGIARIGSNKIQIKTHKNIYLTNNLIGAEGMHSITRNFLKLPVSKCGFGFQYKIKGSQTQMELHLNTKLFGPLYCWIFPNREYFYVGSGSERGILKPDKIKTNLDKFIEQRGINNMGAKMQSAGLNIDYRGFKFGNIFLTGEAAGLVQNLTGEGIFNALVSGEEVARTILDHSYQAKGIKEMIKSKNNQEMPKKLYKFCPTIISILFYLAPLALKIPIIKRRLEKAGFH